MANKYAGTKTEKNLWEAFAGESQARNKYTYFASVAKKAGYEQIAALFLNTAENEKEHAKRWNNARGELGTKVAKQPHEAEGHNPVAAIEKSHEDRYRALLKNVEEKAVFEKAGVTVWECRNCGHMAIGTKAPELCPVCKHPQAYFEVRKENW